MKKILFLLFFFLFFFAGKVHAVTTTISNVPASINTDPFTITVSISGAQTGTNYLKAELFKEGTTNYFGETFNGSVWYKDSDGKQYFPVSIQSGVDFSGQISVKIGSPTQTEYDGSGIYKIRIKRHTSSGNPASSSEAAASAVSINIISPSPTPTLTLAPQPTPTSLPSPTSHLTSTPSPPSPTSTLTSTPSPTQTPTPTLSASYNNIYISEAFVYPNTGDDEWIEIYNKNDFEVKLEGWYIDDIESSGSSTKSLSLTIPAFGYAVFDLTSAMFNNTGDSVRLLDPTKLLKDSFEYISASKDKSLSRISFDTDDFCLSEKTKSATNGSCLNPTPTPTPKNTTTPKPTSAPEETQTTSLENIETASLYPAGSDRNIVVRTQPAETAPQVLGETTEEHQELLPSENNLVYVKGFATSSMLISLLNILYIIHKIFKKMQYEKS